LDGEGETRRGRSMAELAALNARLISSAELEGSIGDYRPRSSDVVITPAGKCGTTWLQQTFHTLRTRGDMDFDDISRVVPWIETSRSLGLDLEAPQRAEPRGFKSHLAYERLPKGARYVVSLRDPKDALVSMYRFMEGWFLEPGAVTLAEYAETSLTPRPDGGGYWNHLISWWGQRENPDVLLLSYEQMTAAPEANVRRLAAFCGIALDDELLALTLERSSLGYMLAHKDRFDDAMMRRLSEARCGLPPGSDSAKVRKGGVGGHARELSAEVDAAMDALWAKVVAPKLGFETYAALEAALREAVPGQS
jgi:Sulfotransferase domain